MIERDRIAEKVSEIVVSCLNGKEDGALVVKGIVQTFGFSVEKIEEHKLEIKSILEQMPDEFRRNDGGGWSFLNLAVDKEGHQWGEHRNMDELVCLAIAADLGGFLLPRDQWKILPGGMPYVVFDI